MSEQSLYTVLGIGLFWLGLYRALTVNALLIKIISFNVAGAGTFMILIASAYHDTLPPDAIPHAIVLTGIVVSVATSALAILLALRSQSSSTTKTSANDHHR
ncbi:Na+/H+ antiporter subunit C [Salinimonas sp. HHU 13199]|uniref:Na+/H+ antiporter subunit C n=1 Tax=Salinimonas profundi TaxID=2729140 RepID=A0ABR8LI13_9ALTE|nr:NADH-quinone oxidoreductase subunit K [Salinimonas profundi]MBD3584940.1 Na+/H+ antiporter subunit C [Salinimonas profundi]